MNDVQDFSINSLYLIKLLSYVLPLFGLLTNSIVILIIRRKSNADIFKSFKQFDYLCLISLFNILILIIQLFSWISDCNFIINIICLDIRKNVFIQLMRVIFKEALIVALRFMCNFAYLGFAFNRILLIGQGHPKIVESIGKCKMRDFLVVSGIISICFSVVKGFKFRVNYDHAEMNYPFNNEIDIWTHNSIGLSIYLLFSLISDFFNYVVFLVASLGVDIYMLIRLRRTLDEKIQRGKILNTAVQIGQMYFEMMLALDSENPIKNIDDSDSDRNQLGKKLKIKKKHELKDSMNNAIRMVLTNSLLNVVFKFPLCIVPALNCGYTIAQHIHEKHPNALKYLHFLGTLNRTYTIAFISDMADFLFLILISIQLFVYIRFDLKMKAGFKRLFEKQSIK